MVKPEWGTKCLCLSCGARFYDLRRKSIVCPKCGAAYQAPAPAKSRRGAAVQAAPVEAAPAKAAPAKAAPAKAAPDVADKPDAPAGAESGGQEKFDDDEKNGKSEDIIEDASELGEDEDDVAEVVDSSRTGGEA